MLASVRKAISEFLHERKLKEAVVFVHVLLEQFLRISIVDSSAPDYGASRYCTRNDQLMDPLSRSYTVDAGG